jgi:hypothetical protein
MIINCDRCEVRELACGDCVVGVLLGAPGADEREPGDAGGTVVQLDAPERRALAVLADQGLVPKLRLVSGRRRRPRARRAPAEPARDAG